MPTRNKNLCAWKRWSLMLPLAVGMACGPMPTDAMSDGTGGPRADVDSALSAAAGVTVSGGNFLLNGAVWVPKGVSMIGALTKGSALNAYSHWGDAELKAAKSYGADAMRFQVSEPALDPQSSEYSASYLPRVESMANLAISNGFVVILCMQDESLAGGTAEPLPTTSTERAWKELAPVFANNPHVLYELYNEPQNEATASGWSDWENGTSTSVGHQKLLNDVRGGAPRMCCSWMVRNMPRS